MIHRVAVTLVVMAWSSLAVTTSRNQVSAQVSFGGQIDVSFDFSAFERKAFTCTPVQPLSKGDVLAAMGSGDGSWIVNTVADRQGKEGVADLPSGPGGEMLAAYPIIAMLRTSDSRVHILLPVILKSKTDINAGKALHSGGYQIEASRSVKEGESICVIYDSGVLMSVEASGAAPKGGRPKPWFTVFKDDSKLKDRASAIEAWRIEKRHVGK
jgi:hypothetical protein